MVRNQLRIFNILIITLIVSGPGRAQEKYLHISAVDLQENPTELVELTLSGKSSTGVTDSNGKTRIRLAPKTKPYIEVELRIVGAPKDYVFISPWDKRVHIPSFRDASQNAVKIVLAERGLRLLLEDPRALKALASTFIFLYKEAPGLNAEQSLELRREAELAEVSGLFNLPPEEIVRKISIWGEKTKDPFEIAQADFIAKNYSRASAGFAKAIKLRKESLFDAYFSYGRSLSEEGKYQESAEAYKEALNLRKEDPKTLNNLGVSLVSAGKYADANLYIQQALAISEKTLGKEHPDTATSLNNLVVCRIDFDR